MYNIDNLEVCRKFSIELLTWAYEKKFLIDHEINDEIKIQIKQEMTKKENSIYSDNADKENYWKSTFSLISDYLVYEQKNDTYSIKDNVRENFIKLHAKISKFEGEISQNEEYKISQNEEYIKQHLESHIYSGAMYTYTFLASKPINLYKNMHIADLMIRLTYDKNRTTSPAIPEKNNNEKNTIENIENIKAIKKSLDNREKSLDDREKSLDDREKSLDDREKSLEKLKQKLEQEYSDLKKSDQSSDKNKKMMESKESKESIEKASDLKKSDQSSDKNKRMMKSKESKESIEKASDLKNSNKATYSLPFANANANKDTELSQRIKDINSLEDNKKMMRL